MAWVAIIPRNKCRYLNNGLEDQLFTPRSSVAKSDTHYVPARVSLVQFKSKLHRLMISKLCFKDRMVSYIPKYGQQGIRQYLKRCFNRCLETK